MKNIIKFKTQLLFTPFLCLLFVGCGSDDSSTGGGNNNGFDRGAMLTSLADNIIIPSYQAFGVEVGNLKSATDNFVTTPNESNFQTLREEWEDAYISWQNVELFITGPGEDAFLINEQFSTMNAYPTNTENINNFISLGSYDLESATTFDEQGFPALDYLLFGLADSDESILALYSTDSNAANYRTYLSDVVTRMQTLTNQAVTSWEGSYRATFVNNTGSSVTSSTNKLANDFVLYYERFLRTGKVGNPAGLFSAGTVQPQTVEALYKRNLSKTLLLESLDACQNFFNGVAFNSAENGESFNSYLDFLNSMKNGEDLSLLINNQFNASRTTIENLNDDFYNQVTTNNSEMEATFNSLQGNVILLKVDMLSALDINVDFTDSDGD